MKKLLALVIVVAMAIGFAIVADAAVGTVVYGYKVDKSPNLEEIDESWGEPAIYVTENSPNAQKYKFWDEYEDTAGYEHGGTGPNGRTTIQPEPSDFWFYVCYTDKYLYIGIKSPDVEFSGSETKHRGDGVHMWLEPMEAVEDPTSSNGAAADATDEKKAVLSELYSYYWNVAFDDYSVDKMFACLNLDENPVIYWDDEYMHAILEIPLTNYGLRNKNLHGYEFAVSVRRVSSKSYYDEGYAGWLQWGPGIKKYTPLPNVFNTIVLVDPAQGELVVEPDPVVTEPVATDAPTTEPPATESPVTEPPATEPPATEPPVTEPPVTEPVATEPPVTEPPATEPVATEPPVTEPPVTEPVATEPPVTEPPATEPPVTEPVATEPPVTEPPATEAPATDAPKTEAPAVDDPAPAEKNNTGLIIAIAAVVVVVGAGLGIVLGKKKK